MSLAVVYSRAQVGIRAPLVTVEAHLSGGVPRFTIVGLPAAAVKESKDRVRGALMNARFKFPRQRIIVNLAPADLPKEGGRFDLPIAIAILAASGQLPSDALAAHEFLGELALTGELRAVNGVLPAALKIRDTGRSLVVAKASADEAGLVSGARVLPAANLDDVCNHLSGGEQLPAHVSEHSDYVAPHYEDLAEVYGQYQARRALEIAAAGSHNLLMVGPPGTGKTMLACRLPGILPRMTEEEAMESAAVLSVSVLTFDAERWGQRPFRSPHHTASGVALVGGGSVPRPGEISLAHNGVLFLDELPEFDRSVLEVLREPLESGRIVISRAARQAEFPARFQLIAAMNPCPCGHLGDNKEDCRCTPDQVHRYRARISGPLLDRIDLHVEVPPVPTNERSTAARRKGEPSGVVRERVQQARERQCQRFGRPNQALSPGEVEEYCRISPQDHMLLDTASQRLRLSARARHRVLRVARTIADLAGCEDIQTPHLSEAIMYRSFDRYLHNV